MFFTFADYLCQWQIHGNIAADSFGFYVDTTVSGNFNVCITANSCYFYRLRHCRKAFCGLIRKLMGEQRLWKGGMSVGLTSAFLFVIMAAHECGVCAYQIKGNQQLTQCRKLYEASSDGVVYASPIQRNEFPWWTLNKNKACIDNDDTWLIEVYDLRLGNSQKHYRLLPKALQNLDMNKARIANLPSEESIEQTRPAGTSADGRLLRDGVEQTVVEFTAANGEILYYVAPRIIDPGDR